MTHTVLLISTAAKEATRFRCPYCLPMLLYLANNILYIFISKDLKFTQAFTGLVSAATRPRSSPLAVEKLLASYRCLIDVKDVLQGANTWSAWS